MLTAHNPLSRIALALVLMAAMLVVAHQTTAARVAQRALPILRYDAEVGNPTWPATLDPALGTDGYSIDVFDLVYASFVKLDYHSYAIVPDLASHWRISTNHKTYWFYLRHNARFSNGDQVTAQDEVWSLTRILAKSTNSPIAMTYFGHILGAKKLNDGKTNKLQGVKAIGKYVVQITLDTPIAYFLKTFSYWASKTLDPRVVGSHTGAYLTNTCSAGVGAGPFMYKCRNKSSNKSSFYPPGSTPTITLVPNPHFYGRKPRIEIVIRPYASYQTGYDAYQANQLDVTQLPSSYISKFTGTPQMRAFPAPSIIYLIPNMQAKPFNNVHCRLAVSYAIDRNTINNDVLHHTYRTIYSMLPKPIQGYYPGNDNPHFNLAKAKSELAQCPGGLHGLKLPYPKISSDYDNEFAAIQSMLSTAGIGIQVAGVPVNTWLPDVEAPENKTHNTIVAGVWGMDFPDPEDFCTLLLRTGETYNVGQFDNPTYNSLVNRGDITLNQKQRTQIYIRAEHIALSTAAWIMLGQEVQYAVVKPWVHGLVAAYGNAYVAPAHGNWANVSISSH